MTSVYRKFFNLVRGALLVATVSVASAAAGDNGLDAEIDYLVEAVADSGCTFIRNGREHDAEDARDHLQMKRERGRRHYETTEQFIDRIASKSSWTGKHYLIRCADREPVPAGDWLHARLDELRAETGLAGHDSKASR